MSARRSIEFGIIFCVLFACTGARAGNKIKYYFNQPVDTTVATFEKAQYLNNCIADTVAAYISRSRYTLDICMYDFEKTISYDISTPDSLFSPKVAAAIDSAYARGVKVRYIYEASNANNGLSLLDSGIHTLGSPQGPAYSIMHNKFMIIDAGSQNPTDAIVWTGCLNWYYEQFNWDYNNVVVVQDSALAHAYTAEFNMMWGDTGIAPDTVTSKFGQFKTNLGRHLFTIDGHTVELYFSPSDGTDSHIQSTIATANTDLYFGMYTFTEQTDANMILAKFDSGIYVSGINDSWSNGYYATNLFNAHLGSHFKVYNETSTTLYHNKFVIIDPSDTCSDPIVLTGSHNWTATANSKNDENTLIIHDDTAANLYYQYFKASFNSLGGTLTPQLGCGLAHAGVAAVTGVNPEMVVYPSPANGAFHVAYVTLGESVVSIIITDLTGRVIAVRNEGLQAAGRHQCDFVIKQSGTYFVCFRSGDVQIVRPVVIMNDGQ